MEDVSIGAPKFAESETAFKEIRDFGEGLEAPAMISNKTAPTMLEDLNPVIQEDIAFDGIAVPPTSQPTPSGLTGNALITTSTELPGFMIENYLLPISLLSPLTEGAESPLDEAFQKIWERAQQLGANALVDLKWKIFPDGTRVLMTATPVTCQKIQ